MKLPTAPLRGALSVAIGLLMTLSSVTAPALAQDDTQTNVPEWAVDDGENWEDFSLNAQASLPSAYDLRSDGLVTPVKFQNPWSSCWAFGGIAAAETSILSMMGSTYAESGLDLSERHLAYFAYSHIPEDSGSPQAGEGMYFMDEESPNAAFNVGGTYNLVTSLFSQGIGPVLESRYPYRGDEGNFDTTGYPCYSSNDDWSIPDTDEDGSSNRLISGGLVLANGNILPEYWNKDKTDNTMGMNAIKQELLNGRGVCITYYADRSRPNDKGEGEYMNSYTYSQYVYDDLIHNHAACIVGWDDNYSASNFNTEHQPPANGAWIVKNSWGSETDSYTDDLGNLINQTNWGYMNEEGKHTGYFYLSYYDRTITVAESMEFSMELVDYGQFGVLQYDYMPACSFLTLTEGANVASTANVFETDRAIELKSVSTSTSETNMRVTYAIYLLDEGAENPTDGTLLYRASKNYEYSGYHRMDLERTISFKKGQRFSIVSTASCVDENGSRGYTIATGFGFDEVAAERYKRSVYYKAVVNEGESWIYENGVWKDWKKQTEDFAELDDNLTIDNCSIKAYVVFTEEESGSQEMYRLYNPNSGEHFYTASESEREGLVGHGWAYEGVGWVAPTGGDPVYRLYNANAGDHHYTMDTAERDALLAAGWTDEGVGWHSDSGKSVRVLREYNPNQFANNHNYTPSQEEHDALIALGWVDEGTAWYALSAG